ncbi:hypothetical protein SO802_012356 [Lithocarpus litseifolius]|uniref:Large ribosomal subunit protein bL12 C-terminal domain-containing protein n=1 Tax=Lithocarpus litseifolius TaxID=425828 RepID=A0AAW2D6K9_9ROSI
MSRGSPRNEMGWHNRNVGQQSPKEVKMWKVDWHGRSISLTPTKERLCWDGPTCAQTGLRRVSLKLVSNILPLNHWSWYNRRVLFPSLLLYLSISHSLFLSVCSGGLFVVDAWQGHGGGDLATPWWQWWPVSLAVTGANVEPNVVEEKTKFDVVIEDVPSNSRISVIKAVRVLTTLALKETKKQLKEARAKIAIV